MRSSLVLLSGHLLAGTLLAGAPVLAGCATPANVPHPADVIDPAAAVVAPAAAPGVGAPRPRFFVEWKPDLPGLTRRPALSKDTLAPEYPAAAVRGQLSGVITLEACVTMEGRLADIHVLRSSGAAVLDTATLDWARVAKFTPAEINGEPFAVCGYSFDHKWQAGE